MENRFGLKDFVLFVMLAAVLLGIYLTMVQRDRLWKSNADTHDTLKRLEGQVGRLDAALGELSGKIGDLASAVASGVTVKGAAVGAGAASNAVAGAGEQTAAWARPGVPILWQPRPRLMNDPKVAPGYKAGGEVSEIWEAQAKTLTPSISTDVYARRVQLLVMEPLGDYNPKTLKTEGVLADAWQTDPEGMWMRVHIRPGVRFSDGGAVTAEDVRWTFHEYIMNQQVDAERQRSILRDSIEKVTVVDESTVEFAFKQRLFSNFDNAMSFFILPKSFYGQFTPAQLNKSTGLLMGSGPFRLRGLSADAQWAPPADIVLERNEQYWGNKPAVAALRYKAVNEEIGRLNAFFAGEADIITPAAPQFVAKQEDAEWKGRAQFFNWTNMRSGYSFIAWNCGERGGKLTPFHDKRVRKAMTLALDRARLIRDIYKGVGEVAKGNQPLASPASNPDIKPWPFDPAQAKALLKEAGWEDRDGDSVLDNATGGQFAFEFTYSGGAQITERIALFVKDSYAAVGIKVTLKAVEWTVFQDVLKQRDFDAITMGWGANSPESDPVQAFHSKSIQNQGDNFPQWSCKEADDLIDAGRKELDDGKRALVWRRLEAVLHDEQPYTFVRVPPWLRFVGKEVGNVNMYPKGLEPAEYFRGGPALPMPAN